MTAAALAHPTTSSLPPKQEPVRLDAYRCSCGKLLGKLAPGSVAELWCERCKRAVLIKAS